MGVVILEKEVFEKVRILGSTYYEDTNQKMQFVKAAKQEVDKAGDDITKHKYLMVGKDLTIQIARKLVQSQKGAAVYPKGQKPKEV